MDELNDLSKLEEKNNQTLQPRNYQVSKKVVHEIKFADKAVMQI